MACLTSLPNEILDIILLYASTLCTGHGSFKKSALIPLAHACNATYAAYKENEVALLTTALKVLTGKYRRVALFVVAASRARNGYSPESQKDWARSMQIAVLFMHPTVLQLARYFRRHHRGPSDLGREASIEATYNFALCGIDYETWVNVFEPSPGTGLRLTAPIPSYPRERGRNKHKSRDDLELIVTREVEGIVKQYEDRMQHRDASFHSVALKQKLYRPGGWRYLFELLGGNVPKVWGAYFDVLTPEADPTSSGAMRWTLARQNPARKDDKFYKELCKEQLRLMIKWEVVEFQADGSPSSRNIKVALVFQDSRVS